MTLVTRLLSESPFSHHVLDPGDQSRRLSRFSIHNALKHSHRSLNAVISTLTPCSPAGDWLPLPFSWSLDTRLGRRCTSNGNNPYRHGEHAHSFLPFTRYSGVVSSLPLSNYQCLIHLVAIGNPSIQIRDIAESSSQINGGAHNDESLIIATALIQRSPSSRLPLPAALQAPHQFPRPLQALQSRRLSSACQCHRPQAHPQAHQFAAQRRQT